MTGEGNDTALSSSTKSLALKPRGFFYSLAMLGGGIVSNRVQNTCPCQSHARRGLQPIVSKLVQSLCPRQSHGALRLEPYRAENYYFLRFNICICTSPPFFSLLACFFGQTGCKPRGTKAGRGQKACPNLDTVACNALHMRAIGGQTVWTQFAHTPARLTIQSRT